MRDKQTTSLADAIVAMVMPTVIITTDMYFDSRYLTKTTQHQLTFERP